MEAIQARSVASRFGAMLARSLGPLVKAWSFGMMPNNRTDR